MSDVRPLCAFRNLRAMTDVAPRTDRVRAPWWVLAFGPPIFCVAFSLITLTIKRAIGVPDYNYDTEIAQLLISMIPWSALLLVILLGFTRWSRLRVQGPSIRWTAEVWLTLGVYLVLGVITLVTTLRGSGSFSLSTFVGVVVACLLVGATEELAFRGLSLGGFARRISVFWAVMASSVLFGLCHITNLSTGSDPGLVARQVVFTFLGGLLFGWLYVFSGRNLWLVALVHGIHDVMAVSPAASGSVADAGEALDSVMNWAHGSLAGLVSGGIPVALTMYGWQKYRGQTLEQALGLAPVES